MFSDMPKPVGGSSGGDEGTLIWTNPNQTLTLANDQLLTLDFNLSNFTKIRIKWYMGGTSAQTRDESKELETTIPVSIIPTGSNYGTDGCSGLGGMIGSQPRTRYFYHKTGDADNTLREYTSSSYMTGLVPWKIYGIK